MKLEVLWKYVSNNFAKGFIQSSHLSVVAFSFFVEKADNGLKLCIDYHRLNLKWKKNYYFLQTILQAIDRVVGPKIYTKLDILTASYSIWVRVGDVYKNTFSSRNCHYEYWIMHFGVINGQATFQRYINCVLQEYLDKLCNVYLEMVLLTQWILYNIQMIIDRPSKNHWNMSCLWRLKNVYFI